MSRRAATDADVRRRAFPLVLGNLAPAPFAVLPFTLLTAALLHNDMPGSRLDWWLLSGGVVTAVSLIAVLRWYRSSRQVRENDLERTLAVVSYALLGLHFGMAPWVVAGQQPDLVMMFAMFASVAGVVGCVMTAGRPDVFRAFIAPLAVIESTVLVLQPYTHLRVIAVPPSA